MSEKDDAQFLLRFEWEGATYEIGYDSLDFGERAEIEEYLGQPWPLIFVSGWAGSYKLLSFLAYLAVRRRRPDVEPDDFKKLTEDSIIVREDGDEDRPTESSPEPSGDPNSPSDSASNPGS